MYPSRYINEQKYRQLQREIKANGFKQDTFLSVDPNYSVYGLNLAFGWPLPSHFKKTYEKLISALERISSSTYLYPYQQTHVTVLTIVNFKIHRDPTEQEICAFKNLESEIVTRFSSMFYDLKLKPFSIDVGPPVLSWKAAFLPILNPTQEISELRKRAIIELSHLRDDQAEHSAIKNLLPENIELPDIIHSTFLRFLERPSDEKAFSKLFENTVFNFKFGEAKIEEFILTSETKPYMRGGDIIQRFKLKV